MANLLALLAVDRAPGSVAIEFADDEVNQLIGIDGEREAAIALVAAGEGAAEPRPISAVASVSAETQPLSPREVHYPEIEQAHRVSSLANGEQAAATRARSGEHGQAMPAVVTEGPIEDVIRRRRSARRFGPRPISLAELEKLLEAAMQPIPGDSFSPLPVEPYLIVNAVDGLARGAYDRQLRLIRRGDFRQTAADLALWQELAGEAGANVYLLADLESLIGQLGQRGYRVAQLAGGICGGRIELAATDLGLAATGLTFFDDSVSRFFEPAAARRQVIYLAAIGSR